jgi:DNA-binding GntR family transcriptional regulator
MSLQVVDRVPTLADKVYQSLRAHLRNSSVRGGEPIQEAQVAEQMGVSRTPVREALGPPRERRACWSRAGAPS